MSSSLALKAALVSGAVVTATTAGLNELTIPLLGVPLTALTMSCAGALCAYAWPRAETSRARLFGVALASTFIGAACVSVIPHLFGHEWPKESQPPLAFLFGMITPWVIPALRGAIPTLVQGLSAMLIRMVGGKSDDK